MKIFFALKRLILATLFILALIPARAAESTLLDADWKFALDDPKGAEAAGFDDAAWRTVTLPHDWSIEGKVNPAAPMGGQGGFFPAGIGWYRKVIDAPVSWAGQHVEVEFEGVYMNADVYLNGQLLTFHPYGYTSFIVDLTPLLKAGAANVLAVRVDNSHYKNTRWYSGSGIYRHVRLHVAGPMHVDTHGVFVQTLDATPDAATLHIAVTGSNDGPALADTETKILVMDPDGKQIADAAVTGADAANAVWSRELTIKVGSPALWSPESPRISHIITRVSSGGKLLDQSDTSFGIRKLAWSAEKGLTINGKTYKLSGGCVHHDNGVLGACAFDRAEERKIQLLKAGGFNAIRTAHNPPSPELLDACDRLGMLVMDEAFDCWAVGKNSKDYSLVFKDWWPRDIESMVTRDRNHPSVVLWSIGNEIPGIYDDMGGEYGPKLAALIHSLDTSRPVTNGILGWPVNPKKPVANEQKRQQNADLNWNSLDIVGSNYALDSHIKQHDAFPNRVLVSTESSPPVGKAFQTLDNSFVIGDFVWSAIDYLGEAGVGRWFYEGDPSEPLDKPRDPADTKPHPVMHGNDRLYPWHGANSGNLDILGNTKPSEHLRNIIWGRGEKLALAVEQPEDDRKVIVVGWGWFPAWESWTWPGHENKPLKVEVYSSYEKVRLYLNGKQVGEAGMSRNAGYKTTFTVAYEPGVLKVAGVSDGKEVDTRQLATAGEASAIRLSADRSSIQAGEQDLSFVNVEVTDKSGNLQPNADADITFEVSGPGSIAGLGNANLKDTTPYQGTSCHVYHGKALVVIRSAKTSGEIKLKAASGNLSAASVTIQSN